MKRAANKKKKRELLKKGLIKASASKGNLNKGGQEGGHTKPNLTLNAVGGKGLL